MMTQYKLTQFDTVIRTGDNTQIPFADGNRDYEEYKLWLADGNTPDPADIPSFTDVREAYFNTEVRPNRERILNRLVGIGLAAQVAGDAATVAAVLTARQALLDITEVPEVLAATDHESLTAAVQSAYHVIIEATPAELRNAFN